MLFPAGRDGDSGRGRLGRRYRGHQARVVRCWLANEAKVQKLICDFNLILLGNHNRDVSSVSTSVEFITIPDRPILTFAAD